MYVNEILSQKKTYGEGIHKRTVLSCEADAKVSPPGENWTSVTVLYNNKHVHKEY